jgi:hypothetical protein
MRTGGPDSSANARGLYTGATAIGKRFRGSLDDRATIRAVVMRTLLLHLVTALLIAGGVLILIAWARPSTNLPSTLLALALAALHLAAALGTALRRPWGRVAGMVVGWIGVLGAGAVLVALVPALPSLLIGPVPDTGSGLAALGIASALLVTYLVILFALLRHRAAFDLRAGGQRG